MFVRKYFTTNRSWGLEHSLKVFQVGTVQYLIEEREKIYQRKLIVIFSSESDYQEGGRVISHTKLHIRKTLT